MLRDHERIAREMSEPVLLRLHRKLERLSSILTVMNTGAHPDDEANGLRPPSAMALAFVPSSPARHVGKAGRTRSDLRGERHWACCARAR